MAQPPIYERKYDRFDPDREMDLVRARIRSEISELKSVGDGVCYHDPSLAGRLVREYPDGRKMFINEDAEGNSIEVPVSKRAKAA